VRSVLVTGAGRGIGRAVALRLAEHGWRVHAGVRRAEDGEALRAAAGRRDVVPVALDIRDAGQVAALPDAVGGRLDAVVNNAGIVVAGPVEGLDLAELRQQLEVNVVAQVAVTQAVLPLVRASTGRIVFVSSISGRVASPFMGAYNASKFGLEGLADAMRIELRPWGVRVVLVEPGAIDTDLWRGALDTADRSEARMAAAHRALYGRHIAGMRKTIAQIQKRTAPVESVAAAVDTALTAERPRARYLVGRDARVQVALRRALPTAAADAALSRFTGGA
jgi:NAD(P)-dependent dehydrogenase (short-subunit alcohol dehydrogenase family)